MRMAVLPHRDQRTILTFNLAIVAQFGGGKSSLINARLETKKLLTGILPVGVSHCQHCLIGEVERVLLQREGWIYSRRRFALDQLETCYTAWEIQAGCKSCAFDDHELLPDIHRRVRFNGAVIF
jgi:hypothetical protein